MIPTATPSGASTTSPSPMGQYTNGTAMNAAAWVTVIVTSGLSLYLAAAVFFGTT